jgi:tRNA A37 threonylcarbamoyladenosine biosynthesis protein TsaE
MYKISNQEQMIEFGNMLAKEHKILLLHGELGAGKTLLTKGFAQ